MSKLYNTRDIESIWLHYTKHLTAMKKEGLHAKGDIAAELAHRERENAELKAEILRAELLVLQGSSGFEKENADLRKDKQRLDWLLGDTGSRYVEKDMALGTWDASEVFETREDIDRVMELEGGDVEQRGLWRWHNAEPEQNIPEELFDGNAVYDELTQAERRYTTPAAVSAVLDATVSLIRMGIKKGGEV